MHIKKTKVIVLGLIILFILNGCSNTKDRSNIVDEINNTVKENKESSYEHDFVDLTFAEPYNLKFPEHLYYDGYTQKEIIYQMKNLSRNETYIKIKNEQLFGEQNQNYDYSFSWIGPTKLGHIIETPKNKNNSYSLLLSDIDRQYLLLSWYGGKLDENNDKTFMKNTSMEERLLRYMEDSGNIHLAYYSKNGYYDIIETDDYYSVLFEIENNEYIGYAYFIDDYHIMECYQFMFLEKKESANKEELLELVKTFKPIH